jgi:hypothetical protein
VTSFDQITSDPELAGKLKDLYGSVDNVDLWVGGLAEDHVRGGSLGQTFRRILIDQFTRTRDGDRFWFENTFNGRDLRALENTTLADVIARNTDIDNLQDDVFFFEVNVNGRVYNDRNANGKQDLQERGLARWDVNLVDADGNVVDTVTTDRNGRYRFSELDVGNYTIEVSTPDESWDQTSSELDAFQISRGMNINGMNFGYARGGGGSPGGIHVQSTDWSLFTDSSDPSAATADGTDPSDLVLV